MKRIASMLAAAVAIVLWTEKPALAYIDPASGSLVLQALLGGLAGVAVLIKMYWRRVVLKFKKNAPDESAE